MNSNNLTMTKTQISDSEQWDRSIILTPGGKDNGRKSPQASPSLSSGSSGSSAASSEEQLLQEQTESINRHDPKILDFEIKVPAPSRPWEYMKFPTSTTVEAILREIKKPGGETFYLIEYEDAREEEVSLDKLLSLPNGQNTMDLYMQSDDVESFDQSGMESRGSYAKKRTRTKTKNDGFVDITKAHLSSDDGDNSDHQGNFKKRRLVQGRITLRTSGWGRLSKFDGSKYLSQNSSDEADSQSDSSPIQTRTTRSTQGTSLLATARRGTRSSTRSSLSKPTTTKSAHDDDDDIDELAAEDVAESDGSAIVYVKRQVRKRQQPSKTTNSKVQYTRRVFDTDSSSSSGDPEPTRRSGRSRKIKSLKEQDVDEEIYADDVATSSAPKVVSVKEIFQPISKHTRFGLVHRKDCDVCGGYWNNSNKGHSPLVYCQGCSSSIHKLCLGNRSGRDHLVTKIGHENFVLQCRRCIGIARKKDGTAPRLDSCTVCNKPGVACAAFSLKKTSKQEEKLREDNGGKDPITEVREELINNDANVLFRCRTCDRGWHLEHLPAGSDTSTPLSDLKQLRDKRMEEYSPKWQCKECSNTTAKVQGLVAWRHIDQASYVAGTPANEVPEDHKEYLVKWENRSHFQCEWMPGSWVWGVTAIAMRKAFMNRDEGANTLPKWTAKEAIPEEWLRVDIIFDVKYDKDYTASSKASDKTHIDNIKRVLVKFQGLGYDEVVWEKPPSPDEPERWSNFVAAYNEYLAGKYFKQQLPQTMKESITKFRSANFEREIELKKQPSSLTGGEIMPYQVEGLNWLLYNFHQQKNVILADEMGLGKTIQIIALLASLIKSSPKCWPFVVVTPNSTCPNWRREIKKWCPELRVVAYYGGREARDIAMNYELFPNNCSDMRAHVVVTSYEAPTDDHSKGFFRRIKWAGMIVDEGQRLKNDKNQLYSALKALKAPFQVLLTGTPLQNNKRELFNLLQFLDPSIRAAEMDEEYAVLTNKNLPDLHDLIRPFFLRRTKLQVLKFLPPMAQVILPVTMSVVQKKLYKSILAKDPRLIRSVFGQTKAELRATERGNLNNILMQLRKCLCHPFIYSSAIEERSVSEEALHRNLIEASAKFQLLEIMLPKLRERGHRALIFSQFLNQLDLIEDFLTNLNLPFGRLDGSISSLEKQKRIDAYNAPGSNQFAFLLSTRAGGVGINLATADTVIIMDPDFNPHQDIQALSRAHRIGQKKKVLVFQLMTKNSAEEKIVQIGRKKMALDQALIESMGTEDDAGVDLESILKHGAEALFNDDDRDDIHYDSASVDKLLDRTQVEDTATDKDKTAESQFSFARIWANDKSTLTEAVGDEEEDAAPSVPNFSVWDKILKQREADAALEAARNKQTFGRGKRSRQKSRRENRGSGSDTDFAVVGESDGDDDWDVHGQVTMRELEPHRRRSAKGTRAKSDAKTQRTPSKTISAKERHTGPIRKTSTKNKTQVSKPTAHARRSAAQKLATPAKKGRAAPQKFSVTVKSRAASSKASASTANAPERSGRQSGPSPKKAKSPDKKQRPKGIKLKLIISSEIQKQPEVTAKSSSSYPDGEDQSSFKVAPVRPEQDSDSLASGDLGQTAKKIIEAQDERPFPPSQTIIPQEIERRSQIPQQPNLPRDVYQNMPRAGAPPSGSRQQAWRYEHDPRSYLQQPRGLQQPSLSSVNPQNHIRAGRGTTVDLSQPLIGPREPATVISQAPLSHGPLQPPISTINYQYVRAASSHVPLGSSQLPPATTRPQYSIRGGVSQVPFNTGQHPFASTWTTPNGPSSGFTATPTLPTQPPQEPDRRRHDRVYTELAAQANRVETASNAQTKKKRRDEVCPRCGRHHGAGGCKDRHVLDKCHLCGLADHRLTPVCAKVANYSQLRMMLDLLVRGNAQSGHLEAARKVLLVELALGRKGGAKK